MNGNATAPAENSVAGRIAKRALAKREAGYASEVARFIDAGLAVMRACGETRPEGTWVTQDMVGAYTELHRMGHAHSLEVWHENALAGGIYGVAVGGLFAGESMFHYVTDASKVARKPRMPRATSP